ncbi:MAG: IS1182 family transposase [Actinobacteria bacterium]|nr:IS1182 family transposase [Actinomycetota bacterium]
MMLGTVDRQGSLLGVDSLLSSLFEGDESSFYARMVARGGELIRDEDFADCYSAGMGRPSIPPSLLMRAVLLQLRDDVSDREAARRAAKDLDWKRALGLEADEVPFHHTTLSVFRSRLLVNDADERVLRVTLERAVGAGLFPKKVLGIVDSTGVMGAAAVADTYELIRQAIAKVVGAAGGADALPKKLRRAANGIINGKARIDWADRSVRRAELGRLVEVAAKVLAATAGLEELTDARGLLERIIDQDVDAAPEDGGGPGIRRGVAPDRVVSVVDPEMRHGRKSASKRVDGYKAHVLTDADNELILGVATTAANTPDGPEAAGLVIAARAAGVEVTEVLGDTAYGDGDTRVAVEAEGAKVTAKTQPPASTGKFTKTDFIIDPDTMTATCPAGHTTSDTGWSTDSKGRRVQTLRFGNRCGDCPLRSRCTTNVEGRSVTLNFHEARLQAARAEQARPAIRRKLRRRSLVERKLAELKMHGLAKARYRGARKTLLQLRLTAGMVNLKKLFTIETDLTGVPVA